MNFRKIILWSDGGVRATDTAGESSRGYSRGYSHGYSHGYSRGVEPEVWQPWKVLSGLKQSLATDTIRFANFFCKCRRSPAELARENFPAADTVIEVRQPQQQPQQQQQPQPQQQQQPRSRTAEAAVTAIEFRQKQLRRVLIYQEIIFAQVMFAHRNFLCRF